MSAGKLAVAALWVVLMVLAVVPGPAQLFARAGFVFLAVAHLIEFLMFLPLLRRAPGGPRAHLVPMLIYGVVHARAVRAGTA